MSKEPQIDELALASLAYFPFLGLLLICFQRLRGDYYTRYHIIHGLLLSLSTCIIFFALIGILGIFQSSTEYQFSFLVVSGFGISIAILVLTGYHFFCAYEAYNGHFTVIPLITKIYYLMFEKVK